MPVSRTSGMTTSAYYAMLLSSGVGGAASLAARFDASDAASMLQLDAKTPVPLPSPPAAGSGGGGGGGPLPTPVPMWASSTETAAAYTLGALPSGSPSPPTPPAAYPAYTAYGSGSAPALLVGGAWWNITQTNSTDGGFVIPLGSASGYAFLAAFRLPSAASGVSTMWQLGSDYGQIRWDAGAQAMSLQYTNRVGAQVIVPIPLPTGIQLPFGIDDGPSAPPPLIISYMANTSGMYVGINGVRVVTQDATTLPSADALPFFSSTSIVVTVAGGTYSGTPTSGGLSGSVSWQGGAFHELIFMSGALTDQQLVGGEAYLASKWQSVGSGGASGGGGGGSSGGGNCPPCSMTLPAHGVSPGATAGIVLCTSLVLVILTALVMNARQRGRTLTGATGGGAGGPPPPFAAAMMMSGARQSSGVPPLPYPSTSRGFPYAPLR